MLKLYKDRKIKYNHPKLTVTQEYKLLKSSQEQRIIKAQSEDKSLDNYVNQEIIYILRNIVKEFMKEFHRNLIQGYNGAIVLIARLQKEYIIHRIWKIARKVTGKCLDCQRNKSARHKPYRMLQPVKTPSGPQEVISQDFIVKLLKSKDQTTPK